MSLRGPTGRGNLPVQCSDIGNVTADPPRRTCLSFRENPGWKQEIATSGFALLAMTVVFGGWPRWTVEIATGINALAMTRKQEGRAGLSGIAVFAALEGGLKTLPYG